MGHKKPKNTALLLIIGFFILLVTPNFLMLTNLEQKSQFSNLTKFPDLKNESTKTAFVKLKKYYLEHYGLKSSLVNSYVNFKCNILDEDPLPNRVVKGNNDWYFLGNYHNNVLNNTFGAQSYSDIDLQIKHAKALSKNKQYTTSNYLQKFQDKNHRSAKCPSIRK